jgi:hypothetical protein
MTRNFTPGRRASSRTRPTRRRSSASLTLDKPLMSRPARRSAIPSPRATVSSAHAVLRSGVADQSAAPTGATPTTTTSARARWRCCMGARRRSASAAKLASFGPDSTQHMRARQWPPNATASRPLAREHLQGDRRTALRHRAEVRCRSPT